MSVAYQTSGSIAVSDEEALRFAEFADQFSQAVSEESETASERVSTGKLTIRKDSIKASLEGKLPGQVRAKTSPAMSSMIAVSLIESLEDHTVSVEAMLLAPSDQRHVHEYEFKIS